MGNIMNNIKVFNTTKKFIHKKDIKNIVKYTTEKLKIKNPIINVIIVNNKKIKELNNKYREKNIETDVLSFALEENSDIIYTDFRLLGDIYISIDKAKEQAKEYGHALKREICYLTVHGTLHLLGYDHMKPKEKEEMREIEESVLNAYDVKRRS